MVFKQFHYVIFCLNFHCLNFLCIELSMWNDKVKLLWLWFVIAVPKGENKSNIYRLGDIGRSADLTFPFPVPEVTFLYLGTQSCGSKTLTVSCVFCIGMTVSSNKDGLGMIVRSVIHGGSISRDGRIGVGDCILSINEESTTNLTNAQARAMLRRHSLIGPDIK